jgi:hypothetical protein
MRSFSLIGDTSFPVVLIVGEGMTKVPEEFVT